jgi:hypothetical protein
MVEMNKGRKEETETDRKKNKKGDIEEGIRK